jgi:ATP synthase protein I
VTRSQVVGLTAAGGVTKVRAASAGRRPTRMAAPTMSESGPPDPLQRVGSEIDRVRARRDQGGPRRGDVTSGGALGFGLRVGIELIAALIVGLGLGWLVDHYIGTRPWGLIAGFFLGSAAGIMNAFRAVQGIGKAPPRDIRG